MIQQTEGSTLLIVVFEILLNLIYIYLILRMRIFGKITEHQFENLKMLKRFFFVHNSLEFTNLP